MSAPGRTTDTTTRGGRGGHHDPSFEPIGAAQRTLQLVSDVEVLGRRREPGVDDKLRGLIPSQLDQMRSLHSTARE